MKQNRLVKNILIYNPFGIGDVLFSTPLIKVLAENFSDAKISYICNHRTYPILQNNPNVSNVLVFEKDHFRDLMKLSKIRFLYKLLSFLKKIKRMNIDLMIDLSLNYQASLMARIFGIPQIAGFNYRQRGRYLTDKLDLSGFENKHAVLYYLGLMKLMNIKPPQDARMEIYTSSRDDIWAENFIRQSGLTENFILGIIPGSGKSWGRDAGYRRWPSPRFAHVADKIIDKFNNRILLLGDTTEAYLCSNMQGLMRNKIINAAGKTTVSQFMSLVKKCGLILCNEGGPLHIAVALGVPTVSIFGPVDEKVYGPYASDLSRHIVVSNRDKCKPCYSKFKYKKCSDLVCINSISEDEVFNAANMLMEKLTAYERK